MTTKTTRRMPRNHGFYVTLRATGERFFIERQTKWNTVYFSADGWTTQATSKVAALRAAGHIA